MRKRKALVLLFTFALAFAMGCSIQNKATELKTGKYVMQDTEIEDWAWVVLNGDNQFEFNRNGGTSYIPSGTYSIEDNVLTLFVSENEEYKFLVDGDKLIFKSGDTTANLVEEGAVFKLSDKDWHGSREWA